VHFGVFSENRCFLRAVRCPRFAQSRDQKIALKLDPPPTPRRAPQRRTKNSKKRRFLHHPAVELPATFFIRVNGGKKTAIF